MTKVYITDYIEKPSVEKKILGKNLFTQKILSKVQKKKVRVLLVWHQRVDKNFLVDFPNIKAVFRYGVGVDNIDLAYLKKKNIFFRNNVSYGVDEVSDSALSLILNGCRSTHYYNFFSKNYANSKWQENINPLVKRVKKTTVGIIGLGRIGSTLIQKLNSIGFKTSFYDPFKGEEYEKIFSTKKYDNLDLFLSSNNVISLHLPLNNKTQNIVDENFIKKLKKNSILINTARGKLFKDLDLLIDPIKSNKISFLGLDVLPDEPANPNSNFIKKWKMNDPTLAPFVMINPHSAYFSKHSFIEMREKAAINAKNFLKSYKDKL